MTFKHDYNRDFTLLDLEHIKERFKLQAMNLLGDGRLYVTSRHDEWYIEYNEKLNNLVLHHKNKKDVTKRYHREEKKFTNVFQIFGYIHYHDERTLNPKITRRQDRLMRLFDQIQTS